MKSELSCPLVTVGIVVYNTPISTFRATLVSLKKSSVSPEIVCLCNSPSPHYQNLIKEICAEFGCICLPDHPNRGFGAGQNVLWRQSQSEWYVCCNPDVTVEVDTIQNLIRVAGCDPSASLLMPKVFNMDGSVQPLARQHPTFPRWIKRQMWRLAPGFVTPYELAFNYSLTQPIEFVTGCFFAVRRGRLEQLNGFDESFFLYAEDADISRRAVQIGVNWFVHDAVVHHVWAADWKRSFLAFKRNAHGLMRYWKKHGWF